MDIKKVIIISLLLTLFLAPISFADDGDYYIPTAQKDILVNDDKFVSFKFKKNSNVTFDYGNHTIEILFKDKNTTSIKQIPRQNQGNFLNIKI